MRNNFLLFSRPSISENDIEAVASVLRSGWITTGLEISVENMLEFFLQEYMNSEAMFDEAETNESVRE